MLAKRLQRELRETLKTAKRGEERIFLEVFAGDANLSRAFQRRRCTVFCIDIRRGPHHDLRCREVFDTVQGWLRVGLVWCLWLGTPCNSFSKARRAPPGSAMPSALRSPAQPRGLPGLTGKDKAKLQEGNALADRAGQLQRLAYALHVPGGEENPYSSYLWQLRNRVLFGRQPHVHDVRVDYCAFGTPFRARTRLRLWGCELPQLTVAGAAPCCTGRGVCSFSGRPHQQLSGAVKGEFATARKNSYPPELCSALAGHFVTERRRRISSRLWTLMKG